MEAHGTAPSLDRNPAKRGISQISARNPAVG